MRSIRFIEFIEDGGVEKLLVLVALLTLSLVFTSVMWWQSARLRAQKS